MTIALRATVCDRNQSYVVRFATDAQAVEYIARKGSTHAFSELEEEPVPEDAAGTLEALYPSCHHGLSLWLCADPVNHYPADF